MLKNLSIPSLLLMIGSLAHSQTVPSQQPPTYSLQSSEAFKARIGQAFPEFEFTDLTGKIWRSESLRGKVVYLNFWFTGCAPCVQEIPSINAMYNYFSKNKNVVMLSINGFESSEIIKNFLKKYPIDMPIATIKKKELVSLAGNDGSIGFPTHLLIDKNWHLAIAASGGNSTIGDSIRKDIQTLLQSKSDLISGLPASAPSKK